MFVNNQNPADELREEIELGQDIEWLLGNAQFNRVIVDGYIKNVLLKESGSIISFAGDDREIAIKKVEAVHRLVDYINVARIVAANSQYEIGGR